MPTTSIISRQVFLNAASAVALSGVQRPKLVAELEATAWMRSADGKKLFPLYSEAAVQQYAEHVRAIRAKRQSAHPTRISIPAGPDGGVSHE